MENIKDKERSVEELALFIKNKTDERQSLYCMLLGAGASKSSGIRTGQDLVNVWRELFYKKICNNSDVTLQEKKALLVEHYDWYKPDNEYSSFFGKIYDLPNQRRNFIELEVNDKEPSIGYHYLNRLADSGNIETFFTTNFDDLLEQSFADIKRPIVCPHDSSIKNISVTSKRTKIIKLHGDFLFNTLQSTEQETQNLSENMKNKFEEFLKNYGLIVVGYAGYDNSIMDELIKLVSSPDYLNNGIYWCIRKEDFENEQLSPKLKLLLQKEKVYYIIIDNFDSFCAKLTHLVLEKNIIPLGATHQVKLEKRQKFFIEQKEKFINDSIIAEDINECLSSSPFSDPNNYEIEKDFSSTKEKDNFKTIKNNDQDISKTPGEIQVYELIRNKEYNKAIETIDKKINERELPSYQYNRYMRLKIQCYIKLRQSDYAIRLIDELIQYNNKHKKDSNIPLLLQKADITPIATEKVRILENALQLDVNNIDIINFLAETKASLVKHNYNIYSSVIDLYDRSISLQPISTNDAYLDKLNFVKHYTFEDKSNKVIETCNQIIQDIEHKEYYSTCVYDAKMELLFQEANKNKNSEDIIKKMKLLYDEYYGGNCFYERNELYLQEYIKKLSMLKYNEELVKIFSRFDSDNRFNISYHIQKADVTLCNFKNLNEAIKILENVDKNLFETKNKWRKRYYANYLEYLLYNKEYNKICEIVDNEPDSKILSNISAYKEALFEIDKNKYFDIIYKDFEESEKITTDYTTLTYNFLKLEMYQDIYDTCQALFNDRIRYANVDINNDILRINYNLAKKKLNKSITKGNLEYIFNLKDDTIEKAAAYILIDKNDEAMKILSNEINKDYHYYYYLQIMPVFESVNFEKLKLEKIECPIT